MELPILIQGNLAVQYYRILDFNFIDLVKNLGLQPFSEIGEPVPPPYRHKSEDRLKVSKLQGEIYNVKSVNETKSESVQSLNSTWAERFSSNQPEEIEKIIAKCSTIYGLLAELDHYVNDRSWQYLHIPNGSGEKKELITELLGYYYRP